MNFYNMNTLTKRYPYISWSFSFNEMEDTAIIRNIGYAIRDGNLKEYMLYALVALNNPKRFRAAIEASYPELLGMFDKLAILK